MSMSTTPMIDDISNAQEIHGESQRYMRGEFYDKANQNIIDLNDPLVSDSVVDDLGQFIYTEHKEVIIPEKGDSPQSVGIISVMEIEAQQLIIESIIYIIKSAGQNQMERLKSGFMWITRRDCFSQDSTIAYYIYKSLSREELRQYTLCFFNKHNVNLWTKLNDDESYGTLTSHDMISDIWYSWEGQQRHKHGYYIPHKVFRMLNLMCGVRKHRQQIAYNIIERCAFDTSTILGVKMFDIRLKLAGLEEFYE